MFSLCVRGSSLGTWWDWVNDSKLPIRVIMSVNGCLSVSPVTDWQPGLGLHLMAAGINSRPPATKIKTGFIKMKDAENSDGLQML